ncbi:hypothetical protein [Actinacidiphila acididurans]|uniref:Uncharacterized protein n=1 Tax=Actinacidiphila acididurans TaxID=2784346 RepID=A0ABS2TIK6_9ACTN|nr:hypothetical protein [Actinacidiphila acididurans]MBM9503179.1 hypothetical protein [Actinacidiphila acididurans]
MTTPSHTPPNQPDPTPFLTVHTALIILAAAFIGSVAGGLTFLSGEPVASAILAGLTDFGASIPLLRSLIR